MLSYGLEATLSQDGSSHCVRIEDVLLSTRGEARLILTNKQKQIANIGRLLTNPFCELKF
jgi:hypothetical protein